VGSAGIRYRLVRGWPIWVPGLIVVAGIAIPLVYLFIRAVDADFTELAGLLVRPRNLVLLGNTLMLAVGVLATSTLVAFPLAWLATRGNMHGRRFITLLGVLPLSIPGYVMAYVLLAATGRFGASALLLGIEIPRLSGYTGALIALSTYTFPYLFLNLRSALTGLDVSLEESARSLGLSGRDVFLRVILPQLKPAYWAGSLLIVLHVLGDFGVVSLMRFETFSYAIYLQYAGAFDRLYAAWLAIMLLLLTGSMLLVEARVLRNTHVAGRGPGSARTRPAKTTGGWGWLAWPFLGVVAGVSVVLPLTTLGFWAMRGLSNATPALLESVAGSLSASLPTALLTVVLAIPIAYASVRMPRSPLRVLERFAYMGYAIPPLALALAVIFASLALFPALYQTLGLLVFVCAIHFLAEALGPIRSAFMQTNPAVEESARVLGRTPLRAFMEAVLPVVRPGIVASLAFVFLSMMKELPLTFLLSPVGFRTLALNVWSHTNEALYAQAAPHALLIVLFSAIFVGLLLRRESRRPLPHPTAPVT